ncbi:hypothetical protein DEJ33_16665 [Curtobacterium sp. MCPF17_047]|uniref:hypothetical protein n=1 Tax=unclassified Curtobacterium TaxID=257496 RepID=UPI000DA9A423|nr:MULTISPECIES: hypothetical protein [unclassified Curtobacterium]PZE55754.1 hypothetical protein DEJ24_14090 [Curtobacterium sp. MCPF17_001]PZF60782.1 hypothetical protein DEJ33_16665 [Curtobacterium sp. MCPF17_047]
MPDTTPDDQVVPRGRPAALRVLIVVVGLEFLAMAAVTVFLLVELLTTPATSIASAVALLVLAVLATVWLGAMLVGLRSGRAWVRSGIIVWQVLQGALAIGAFQGVFRVPAVGWALLIPALLAITLVLSKSVTAVLARRD